MCPPADDLLGFLAGQLATERASAVEIHMDVCMDCRASVSDLVRDSVPEPRFGRYQVETVIGDGGMGIVYRAFDPQLARAVAIKVVKTSGDDEALRVRLVREAQSLARLSHSNVCQVYDVGREGEEVWVAMELIHGVNLRLWAATRTAAEIEAALVSAAHGIAAAHAVGLIHRDIKPENVLVTHAGRTVVTDFGLARTTDGARTSDSRSGWGNDLASGTPAYMAPEQLTAAPLDARVDQFAWAVMAWELLTHERPFPVEAAARLAAIRAGVAPPLRLPAHVARVVTRALSSAADDRFRSMEALLEALSHRPARRSWGRPVATTAAVLAVVASVIPIVMSGGPVPGHVSTAVGAALTPDQRPGLGALDPRDRRAPSSAPPASSPAGAGLAVPVLPIASTAPQPASPRGAASTAASPVARAKPAPPGAQIATGAPPPGAIAAPSHAVEQRRAAPDRGGAAEPVPKPGAHGGSAAPAPDAAERGGSAAPAPHDADRGSAIESAPNQPAGGSAGAAPDPGDAGGSAGAARYARFDRDGAERRLADCRFPIDPGRPERALAGLGAIVDWGPVRRRLLVRSPDSQFHTIYEVQGRRELYWVDAGGLPKLGVLTAGRGDLIVVCPYERPGVASYAPSRLPPGSPPARGPAMRAVYAFAPAELVPRIAGDLRDLAPVHIPEAMLRAWRTPMPPALARRKLLVWAQPTRVATGSWDMNGWTLDVTDLDPADLAQVDSSRPMWLVVDQLRVEGSPGDRHLIVHGVRALASLLR